MGRWDLAHPSQVTIQGIMYTAASTRLTPKVVDLKAKPLDDVVPLA